MGGTQWSRWYIRTSDYNYTWFDWGQSADTPLVGDFDDDGRDDFAVYRGTTGHWYIYHWTGHTRTDRQVSTSTQERPHSGLDHDSCEPPYPHHGRPRGPPPDRR